MSTHSGRGKRPQPTINAEQNRSATSSRRPSGPRTGIASKDDVSITLLLAVGALVLSMISIFLPWSYPVPDQRWWEKLLSFEIETGPRLSGIDFGFGKSAAFTAGLAILAILITAISGVVPKVFSAIAFFFALMSSYHVMNAFREVTNGELWWIENDELRTMPAAQATWDTFIAMLQNGYGLAIAVLASLTAVGATAELINVAVGSRSVAKTKFREPEALRLSIRVACALTLGFVWTGPWWWATLTFAIVTAALWLVSGNRFDSLTMRTAVVPVISVVGLLSALHSFIYR